MGVKYVIMKVCTGFMLATCLYWIHENRATCSAADVMSQTDGQTNGSRTIKCCKLLATVQLSGSEAREIWRYMSHSCTSGEWTIWDVWKQCEEETCEKKALWAADSQEKHGTGPKIRLEVIKMVVKINLKWWTSKELTRELQERCTIEGAKNQTMENKRKEHY